VPDAATVAQMSEAERKVSFFHQPVWSRAAVVVAGPLANFILAIVIFAAIFSVYGKESTAARVATVQLGSAAEAAGFQSGDLVLSIDGHQIESFSDLQRIIVTNPGQTLKIVVDRGGVHETLTATPIASEVKDNLGNVHRQGMLGITRASVAPGESAVKPVDPLTAVVLGIREAWSVIDSMVTYLARVVVGRESPDQLGGPIRIAQIAGQVWQGGLHNGGIGTAVHRHRSAVRDPVGLHWTAQRVSHSTARWRAPAVLRRRGRARAPPIGARSGGRLPVRAGGGINVNDFRHL
jgi:regulator of sigma E protease